MKKLLALVLALVMTLGLATVSASAKTFADDADITYKEAVDVLSGVGVLSGMGENKFAPKEELTRAQAAKIIAYLDLGETAAENLPASKTFSDVPADHWASKYIAYCYSAGIVGGVGGGKFSEGEDANGDSFYTVDAIVDGSKTNYTISDGSKSKITDAETNKSGDYTGSGVGLYVIDSYDNGTLTLANGTAYTLADNVIIRTVDDTTVKSIGANNMESKAVKDGFWGLALVLSDATDKDAEVLAV